MKYIIGIDEAGRGPLAGPLTLSAFLAPENLRNKLIKILGGKIKDSKQFSPAKRHAIYREFLRLRRLKSESRPEASALKKQNEVFFCVSHISNKIIDKKGISYTTRLGIKRCLNKLQHENSNYKGAPCSIRLDGSLKAPEEFKNQKTIIGGDSVDIFIACASIVAKVRRDRLLIRLAKKFSNYSLEIHKGYGTALHYRCIKEFGISEIHRKSFLTKIDK